MTLNLTRTLLATTAFVGIAAASQAAPLAVTNSATTVQATSSGTGGVEVTGNGSIDVTGGSAITLGSDMLGENDVTVGAGSVVSNTGANATIADNAGSADLTMEISGTVINNTPSEAAIGLGTLSKDATINVYSTGVISGSVTTGSGDDALTVTGGSITGAVDLGDGANALTLSDSATITGDITTGTGDDAVEITSSTVNGALNLGSGTAGNTLLVSNSTVSVESGDAITVGAATANVVRLSNATVSGSIAMTGGTLYVSNSTVTGSYAGGTGDETLTLENGSFTGDIEAGATGTDVINFTSGTVSLNGALSNFDTVNVDAGTVNVNGGLSAGAMAIDAGATVNIGSDSTATGLTSTLTNNGTLNLNTNAAGFTASAITFGTGSVLGVTISDSTTASKLISLAGISGGEDASVTVTLGSNAGYIANGTSYTIISAASGAVTTPTMVTSNPLYTYNLTQSGASNGDISLTLVRKATSELVESSAGKSVANALDSIGNTVAGDIHTIQSNITAATSAGQINTIVESLTPATDAGAVQVTANVGLTAGNNVTTRLASLRSGSALSGVATGSGMYQKNMWVQGFGNTTSQDNKDGNAGYDASTGGATFGMDTDSLVDGYTTGAAVTYARSNVDSNASNDAQSDIDSYLVTLYGSRVLDNGYFLNGQAGVGFNQYDTERQVSGFTGKTTADFDGMQYSAKLEAGRDIALNPCMTLTPLAGVQYTHLDVDGYTESGPAALNVDDASFDAVDLSAGAQLGWNLGMDNGNILRPNLRAKYIYRAGDTNVSNTSRFVAGGPSFNTEGVSADRSSLNLGAGLLLTSVRGMDLSLDYDADIRDSLTGHTGQVKVRMPF